MIFVSRAGHDAVFPHRREKRFFSGRRAVPGYRSGFRSVPALPADTQKRHKIHNRSKVVSSACGGCRRRIQKAECSENGTYRDLIGTAVRSARRMRPDRKNRRRMNLRRGVTGAAQKRSPPEKPHRLFWRRSLHSVFGEPARGLLSGRFCGPRPGMSAAAPGRRAECYFSEPLFSRTLRFSCPMRFLMAAYCDSHTSR